jgi:hypothetical protein
MNSAERNRIERLLQSVEREEEVIETPRPTGSFVRQLFTDSDEDDKSVAGSVDDEGGESMDIDVHDGQYAFQQEEETDEQPGDNGEFDILVFDDFDDLENLPLNSRLNDDIVKKIDGSVAYISRNRKMLWDIQSKNTNT